MRILQTAAISLLLLTFPHTAAVAGPDENRQTVGLVLSGGGARGGAHVGILKALEELEVPVDYIAGTSMGAIIGALYAAGYSAGEIETILEETDWKKALSDRPARPDRTMRKKDLERQFFIPFRVGFNKGSLQLPLGAIEGQHLDQIFHQLLFPVVGIDDFDRLPIPFRAVATDLVSGQEVVLKGGSLPDALRASMSVPGVFAPVRIEDRLLVDGGMANNLPVSVVREMGADIVIAVDISTPLLTEEQLTSILSVTEQLTGFLTRKNTDEQIDTLKEHDVLIVPELGEFSSTDFAGASEIVSLGYEAAMRDQTRLAGLSRGRLRDRKPPLLESRSDYIVQFIEIDNGSVLNDELIRSRVAVEIGQPIDLAALDRSLDQIYSLDVFESVTYDLVRNEDGEQGVVIHAAPRSWGPNYLQLGLQLSADFSDNSSFKLGAAYTRNALNSLGGELRVVGSVGREDEISFDFYQPIDLEARWFVEPQLYLRRQNFNLWVDDVNVAELRIGGWGSRFGIGRNFNTTNRLRLNYEFGRGDADVITGNPGFPFDDRIKVGELTLEYLHDSLDNLWFPRSGMIHRFEYHQALDVLGAAFDYNQLTASGSFTFSRDRNSFVLNYQGGYSFNDKAPFERWYRLGGLGRLSGLAPQQLSGRHVALASAVYFRTLKDGDLFRAYAGASFEAGNVWEFGADVAMDDLRYSGALFLGADTPIGPIYLAYGHSDSGDNAVYFYVGNPFRVRRFD